MIEQEIKNNFSNDILNIIYKKIHEIDHSEIRKAIKKINTHKTCKTCRIEKPVEDFHIYKKKENTLWRSDCKKCRNAKIAESYSRGRSRAIARGIQPMRSIVTY